MVYIALIDGTIMEEGPVFPEQMITVEEGDDAEFILAKQIAQVIKLAEDASLIVPVPNNARKFAERVFREWLDDAASVARARRQVPFIAKRSEFVDGSLLDPDFDWSQGITLDDIGQVIEDMSDEDPGYLMDVPSLDLKGPLAALMNTRSQLTTEPLAGHYNRFLPMKLSLRVLLSLILGAERYDGEYHSERAEIHIEDFRDKALDVAVYAKKWFAQLDSRAQINVGSEITVGFPDLEDETKKSHERFVSQFVGSVRKKGSGSLCEMGFIRVDEEGLVQITREGYFFATTPNPIIDATPEAKRGSRMSMDEKTQMWRHIQRYLPAEWEFMAEAANLIDAGVNKPSSMDMSMEESRRWGKGKTTLMRNGVLSRMQELGFIDRTKDGRNVTYHLTEIGNRFFVEGKLWGDARTE